MNTGAWTVALLLLTTVPGLYANNAPPEVYHVPKQRFEIPIRIDPARKGNIKALELYFSTDKGLTWSQCSSATPDQTAFQFAAQADGEYWFIVVIVDQQNRRDPPDPLKAPPGQKIVIDTLKPEVKVRAERKNDGVSVSWDVREEHPNFNAFRVEWRPADAPEAWMTVQTAPSTQGRAVIRGGDAMVVRVTIADRADNLGSSEASVPAASGITPVGAVTGPPDAVAPSPPLSTLPEEPSGTDRKPPVASTMKVSAGQVPDELPLPTPPLPEEKPIERPVEKPVEKPARKTEGSTGNNVVAVTQPPEPPVTQPTPREAPVEDRGSRGVPPIDSAIPSTPAASPPETERATQAELQIVSNRSVTMEYEVSKVGSSGVGSVDLYMTRDDGLTWTQVKADHSAASGEAPPGVMRRTLTVNLVDEGIYGFYMVVKSGAGLSLPAPDSNTAPQMRLKLDTRQPEATLFRPDEDKKHLESLLITWKATDDNLEANPITIEWADKLAGPWEHIGQPQLPNTGSYSWKVPAGVPPKVYFRLTVRDKAGNAAVAETREPQHIDFSKPSPKIIGVIRSK